MGGPDSIQRPVAPGRSDAIAAAVDLAKALKCATIYPATHPRVDAAATAFVGHLHAALGASNAAALIVRPAELEFGGVRTPADDPQIAWLAARLREVGLRGLQLTKACTGADVVAFANTWRQGKGQDRSRALAAWPADHASLRPLPLVFSLLPAGASANPAGNTTDPDANGEIPAQSDSQGKRQADEALRTALHRLATNDEIQAKLRAIESACRDDAGERRLDLLGAIADLLPADVSVDAEQIEAAVRTVLADVERRVHGAVRQQARSTNAALLERALDVAPKFFSRRAPQGRPAGDLPSGRPGDEHIAADLDSLVREVALLPEATDVRLPPTTGQRSDAALAREMFGLCLHVAGNSPSLDAPIPAPLIGQLATLRSQHDQAISDLITTHLQGASTLAIGRALRALVEAGYCPILQERRHVDANFVAATFPTLLPLATRVLGHDERGLAVLRQGLLIVARNTDVKSLPATETARLAEPDVVRMLTRLGGTLVLPFLLPAAGHPDAALRQLVFEWALRTLPVNAEVAALRAVESVKDLPRDFLHEVLLGTALGKVDPTVRSTSGRVLRAAVERCRPRFLARGPEPLVPCADLVTSLHHVPGSETRELLRKLARFHPIASCWAPARAVQNAARGVLTRIAGSQPKDSR